MEMDSSLKASLQEGGLSAGKASCVCISGKGRRPLKTALPSSLRDRDIVVSVFPLPFSPGPWRRVHLWP